MRISSGLAAVVLTGWLAPAMQAAELARADLSGVWRLDPAQSEDGRAKLREMRGDRPRGGGRLGGGRGRPTGGPGGPAVGGGADALRESLRDRLDAPPALTVTQTATEITLLEEDGRLRALHPDGRAYKDSDGREVKTRWSEAGELVSETKGERGKIVETFSATKDPARLLVTLLIQARGQTLAVRRVYVRPQDAPAAPPPGELPAPTPPTKLK